MSQVRHRGLPALRTVGVVLALAILLTVSVVASRVVFAQDMATPEPDMALGVPTVSVSGHGSVIARPDTASVNVGVEVIKPTLDEAQETASVQTTAVVEALEEAGIASEDIQTAQFNVNILR